jgi:hypothetical protein
MKCPKCNADNPDTQSFCGDCGTQLGPLKDIGVTKTLETPAKGLDIGSTFAGRYQIIEELGKGGMGAVYKALDTQINEEVAIKLIRPEIASDEKTLERLADHGFSTVEQIASVPPESIMEVPGVGVKTAEKVVAIACEYMRESSGVSMPAHETDETLGELEVSISTSPEHLDGVDDEVDDEKEEKVAVQAYGSDGPHDPMEKAEGTESQNAKRGLEEQNGTGGES